MTRNFGLKKAGQTAGQEPVLSRPFVPLVPRLSRIGTKSSMSLKINNKKRDKVGTSTGTVHLVSRPAPSLRGRAAVKTGQIQKGEH